MSFFLIIGDMVVMNFQGLKRIPNLNYPLL